MTSVTKNTHSVPHFQTKLWIKAEMPRGLATVVEYQMPGPVIEPTTSANTSKTAHIS